MSDKKPDEKMEKVDTNDTKKTNEKPDQDIKKTTENKEEVKTPTPMKSRSRSNNYGEEK